MTRKFLKMTHIEAIIINFAFNRTVYKTRYILIEIFTRKFKIESFTIKHNVLYNQVLENPKANYILLSFLAFFLTLTSLSPLTNTLSLFQHFLSSSHNHHRLFSPPKMSPSLASLLLFVAPSTLIFSWLLGQAMAIFNHSSFQPH